METSQASRNGKPYLLPDKPLQSLDDYIAIGGLKALEKARSMPREAVIAEVKKSGLRGRGGAGFPVGIKWASIASDPCPTKFVACNATEGEPGTYKDRMMMGRNPYQLLEGVAIAAYAMNAQKAFIAMKGTFENAIASTARAHKEMTARKVLGDIPIEFVYGPEDYLLGEEKAMLEVIEGREAMPREMDYPPYILGLFAGYPSCIPDRTNPTLVNNCESMSTVTHIIRNGADWFRSMGTADTPGHTIFTLSGDVQREGLYELPMGTTMRELIEKCGRRHQTRTKTQSDFLRRRQRGALPRIHRHAARLRLDAQRRLGARLSGLHGLRRFQLHGAGRAHFFEISVDRILRPMPLLQRRHVRSDARPRKAYRRHRQRNRHRRYSPRFHQRAARQSLLFAHGTFAHHPEYRAPIPARIRRTLQPGLPQLPRPDPPQNARLRRSET